MSGRGCPVIGLAGGVGSGKSTVAGIFKQLGAVIIDADRIAHRVLDLPDTRAAVAAEFGQEVMEGGSVSRKALGAAVFDDRGAVSKLESIVHPVVIAECRRLIAASRDNPDCKGAILDAPLLFEAGLDELCDVIVFVEAAEELRKRRLAASRGWDSRELARREKFQDSLISKSKRADYIIENDGSLERAAGQAAAIWKSACNS